MSQQNDWYYSKADGSESKAVGPFSDNQLVSYLEQGVLGPQDLVNSASKTAGQWREIKNFPKAMAIYKNFVAKRQAEAAAHQAKANAQAEAEARQKAAERQQWEASLRAITDSPTLEAVAKIRNGVNDLLMTDEEIIYIAIQSKPVAIKADAVIATSKRLIFYRPKIGGRVAFDDFLWRDLSDAHIETGLIASTFTCRHQNGEIIKMEYMDKKSGNKLYRLAQEQEEIAFQIRREMELEEKRAGATNLGYPPPQNTQSTVNMPVNQSSPVEKLQQLKQMLDAELITPEEFNAKKTALLAEM